MQALFRKITLNCKGKIISLEKPAVMGILNITPDSFFKGSRISNIDAALKKADQMLSEGALILDIGAYSSRPGADDISVDEELKRAIPVVEAVFKNFPDCIISIDTFRSKVAKNAVNAGAHIVNDISSGDDDPEMPECVASMNTPYIMMHKKGTSKTMQKDPRYDDVVLEVLNYFTQKIAAARQAGIVDIIIDPGFGFGKNIQHNYALLNGLSDLGDLGLPVLAGISRKKMIQTIVGTDAEHALNGTTAANTIALLKGANILRVHDVKEAVECINIVNAGHGSI